MLQYPARCLEPSLGTVVSRVPRSTAFPFLPSTSSAQLFPSSLSRSEVTIQSRSASLLVSWNAMSTSPVGEDQHAALQIGLLGRRKHSIGGNRSDRELESSVLNFTSDMVSRTGRCIMRTFKFSKN